MKQVSDIVDISAESGIISTIVKHPEYVLRSSHLKSEYFSDPTNGALYDAVCDLYLKRKITTINALNLEQVISEKPEAKQLLSQNNLPDLREYLMLASGAERKTIEEFNMLVTRVVSLAFRRALYVEAGAWQKMCLSDKQTLDTLSNSVFSGINNMVTQFVTNGVIETIGKSAVGYWEEAKERAARGDKFGFPSSIPALRDWLYYEPGELYLLAADKKVGKSWFGLTEVLYMCMNGIPSLYFDSEMDDQQFTFRILGYLTGLDERKIKNVELTDGQKSIVEEQMKFLQNLPLYHVFNPTPSVENLYSVVLQKHSENDVGFVCYDYIKPKGDKVDAYEVSTELGTITDFLKRIAGELKIPVLCTAQVGRNGRIAQSDLIERFVTASMEMMFKSPDERTRDGRQCGDRKLIIRMYRHGNSMYDDDEYIDLKWDHGIKQAEQHRREESPYDDAEVGNAV